VRCAWINRVQVARLDRLQRNAVPQGRERPVLRRKAVGVDGRHPGGIGQQRGNAHPDLPADPASCRPVTKPLARPGRSLSGQSHWRHGRDRDIVARCGRCHCFRVADTRVRASMTSPGARALSPQPPRYCQSCHLLRRSRSSSCTRRWADPRLPIGSYTRAQGTAVTRPQRIHHS
jgi:hypothetical protein